MPFLFFCTVPALLLQLFVLFGLPNGYRRLRFFSLVLMEALPLGGALCFVLQQPSSGILGWEFSAAMCLWMAGAVLLGYLLAWAIYVIKQKEP